MSVTVMPVTSRLALLPDISTIAESGVPKFEVSRSLGYFAPAATPREVVSRLHAEISKSIRHPDVQKCLRRTGQRTVASRLDDFAAYVKAELAKWEKVAQQPGGRVN